MFNLTGKKYFLVGNCTFAPDDLVKLPNQDVDFIKVNLPIGFKQATGKKYIKLYGCTLTYAAHFRNSVFEELQEQTYTPMHTTFHSNMTNMTNTRSDINIDQFQLDPENPPTHLDRYTDYVSTTNNYMMQKSFEISNEVANNEIHFYFIDQYGQRVKILKIDREEYNDIDPNTGVDKGIDERFFSFQALYKIEMELISS
jgi:hypothetical protein